jgi:hypothetical protein
MGLQKPTTILVVDDDSSTKSSCSTSGTSGDC